LEKLNLDVAIWELLGDKKTFRKEGVFMRNNQPVKMIFTVGNFLVEADVVEVQRKPTITKDGNIFRRIKIRDEEHEAILVVWGSKSNRRNLDLFSSPFMPERIRIKYPVRPSDRYIMKYGVALWAHQDITIIETITSKDPSVFRDPDEEWEENEDLHGSIDQLPDGYEDILHPEGEGDYDSEFDFY